MTACGVVIVLVVLVVIVDEYLPLWLVHLYPIDCELKLWLTVIKTVISYQPLLITNNWELLVITSQQQYLSCGLFPKVPQGVGTNKESGASELRRLNSARVLRFWLRGYATTVARTAGTPGTVTAMAATHGSMVGGHPIYMTGVWAKGMD